MSIFHPQKGLEIPEGGVSKAKNIKEMYGGIKKNPFHGGGGGGGVG